jgi:hypothetical protein
MNVDEQERKHKQTDLDVEIVDLPDDNELEKKLVPVRPLASFQSSVKPVWHGSQRRVQLVVIASMLAIVVIVLLATSLPVRNLAVRLVAARLPTPTATLVPGVDLFYISGEPSWGQAYLDGQVLKPLPRIGIDAPLRLARGLHTLEWRAAPFQVQRCLVSVPPNYGVDTCHYSDPVGLSSGMSVRSLSFQTSLQLLPDNQRRALVQAAQTALDTQRSTETVQPGELYDTVSQRGIFVTAQQPLRAMLHFQLDTNPSSPISGTCVIAGQSNGQQCVVWNQDCREFCDDPSSPNASQFSTQAWDVLGIVLPVWDYTTLQGKTIAQNQPDGFGGAEGDEFPIPLHIAWNGNRWQVTVPLDSANTLPFGNPFCASAENEVQIDPSLSAAELQNQPVMWKYASGPVGAAGCVAVAVPNSNPSGALTTPTPLPSLSSIAAYCIQRFGVLLAANDVAHRLWPTMPMADAYEQQLAQQLVVSNGLTK